MKIKLDREFEGASPPMVQGAGSFLAHVNRENELSLNF